MRFRRIAPGPQAAAFVDQYWLLETGPFDPPQRVVPDGAPELILHLGTPLEALDDGRWRPQPQAFLAGQLTAPLLLRPCGPARVLGVTFRPDALPRLLDARSDELTSGIHALDLGAVDSIASLERWLLARNRPPADPS